MEVLENLRGHSDGRVQLGIGIHQGRIDMPFDLLTGRHSADQVEVDVPHASGQPLLSEYRLLDEFPVRPFEYPEPDWLRRCQQELSGRRLSAKLIRELLVGQDGQVISRDGIRETGLQHQRFAEELNVLLLQAGDSHDLLHNTLTADERKRKGLLVAALNNLTNRSLSRSLRHCHCGFPSTNRTGLARHIGASAP